MGQEAGSFPAVLPTLVAVGRDTCLLLGQGGGTSEGFILVTEEMLMWCLQNLQSWRWGRSGREVGNAPGSLEVSRAPGWTGSEQAGTVGGVLALCRGWTGWALQVFSTPNHAMESLK